MLNAGTFMMSRVSSGFVPSVVYSRSQWVDWRRRCAADAKEENRMRQLSLVDTSYRPDGFGVRAAVDLADCNCVGKSHSASRQASSR
jgi:hypothetical protein